MGTQSLSDAGLPDPERISTPADFGRELTLARDRAGLTVRQVARAAQLPASTTGDYFAGRHLPPAGQPDALLRILAACGETDPDRVAAWTRARARARRAPGRRPSRAVAPYRGLASFQPEDADWFFGREELTGLLLEISDAGAPGIPLMVVGPSGSGKSSLLRAGLVPRLRARAAGSRAKPEPPVALFTPGGSPLAALAGQIYARHETAGPGLAADLLADPGRAAELAGPLATAGAAIVVDQFEETFAACDDEQERQAFITALCALCAPAVVVLGMRADFYATALRYPPLARALQERQVVVGPMTARQLTLAITEPARKAGLEVEDGLVELLLADLAPGPAPIATAGAAHDPGTLPLLSHALLATWEHSRGSRLTVAGYRASDGIKHAIARTAENAYQALSPQQQLTARQLFLRLARVAEDGTQTRSRVTLRDLASSADASDRETTDVLERFVAERLVTVGDESAEITHEALLAAWPRLVDWIDSDRAGLRIRRRVSEAAQAWLEADRDDAALLRGGQLALAREWAADPAHRASLGTLAREFLDQADNRERTELRASARRTRRLRYLAAALAVMVVAAGSLAGYALRQRQSADAARADADSRGTAIEADQARGQDVSLAAQLSLAAYQIAPTPDALASLLESSGMPMAARVTDTSNVVEAVALDPRHALAAVAAADGTLRLWHLARPGHPDPAGRPLTGRGAPLYTAAFSPAGTILAAAGKARRVRLWELTGRARAVALPPLTGPRGTVYSVAFSPRGDLLAAGCADDRVWLWNVASPRHARLLASLTGPAGYVESVAFSPDGGLLAAGSADKTVRLWDVADPARPRPAGRALTGPAGIVTSVAFSPDGGMLAAGSQDDSVWLWNVSRPTAPRRARAPLAGATDWVNAVAFSPDGTMLAAGSSDDTVRVWNVSTGALDATLPHPDPVTSVVWASQRRLVTGGADGTMRLWTMPSPVLAIGGPANSVAFSPDGTLLAVGGPRLELWKPAAHTMIAAAASAGTFVNPVAFQPSARPGPPGPGGALLAAGYGNGQIRLWHTAAGRLTAAGPVLSGSATGMTEDVAFSPRGSLLASGGDDGTVRLWNVADPARPQPVAIIHDSTTYVLSVAFSPDGKTLAAGSADDDTRLWDIADPARPRPLGRALTGPTSYVYSVAFSPDGHTLAVGSADQTVRLWDVALPDRPRLLGRPLTGPESYVYCVTFSPDGRTLAAAVTDGSVWLWRVADPAHPVFAAQLTGPAGHVYAAAFSPSGRTLSAASADGTVRLWDTRTTAAAAAICASAGQPLTRTEWSRYLPGRPYHPPCPGH